MEQKNETNAAESKVELHVPVVSYRLMCGVLKMLTAANCISGRSTPTEGHLSQETTKPKHLKKV